MLDTAANIQAQANAQATDLVRRHQVKVKPKKISTETVRDTTLPTFKDKLTQIADNLYTAPMKIHDHRVKLIEMLEASVAHRHLNVCIIDRLSSNMTIGFADLQYAVDVPVGKDIRVVANQFRALVEDLGFTNVEETMTIHQDYNLITLKLTW